MRTVLLALALSPTLAVVPCSSDKPDDVDTEGCYGWCSAAFAAELLVFRNAPPGAVPAEGDEAPSWRTLPSNPSSFKKLSTTEDL